jgi:ligand-binding sensor domain-containing protein
MVRTIIVLFFLVFQVTASAISNKFNYITVEDGLAQGNITCIFQDSKGFMWFGTFNGLNRYDGYNIKVFNNNPEDTLSLSHGHIKFICEDKENKIWFGTGSTGISIYYPETGIFRNLQKVIYQGKEILLTNMYGLAIGPDGDIWGLDRTLGLFVFDINLKLKKAYLPDPQKSGALPAMEFSGLVFDKDKNCWVGAGMGTLCKLDNKTDKFELFTIENNEGAKDEGIKTLYIDQLGLLWIGTTSQGAYSFDRATHSIKNYIEGSSEYPLSSNTVLAFYEDWDGNLLIGTDGGGINVLNRKTDNINVIRFDITNPESISVDAVYSIYIDRSETIWVGTYSGGINYCGRYRYKFKNYKQDPLNPNGLGYKNVKCFLQDSDGEIWVGTDGGGLDKFDPLTNTFKHIIADPTKPNWLHSNIMNHIIQDNEGDIYLAHYLGGLTIFNKKTGIFKQYLPDQTKQNGIAGPHAMYVFQDSYGIIWVGMLLVGLEQFNKSTQSFKLYQSNPSDPTTLKGNNVKIIFEDKNRQLWIGTEGGGLHKYNRDKDNFTRYYNNPDDKKSLCNDDIRALYEDTKGRFWIGTIEGLCLMNRDSATFRKISVENGLPGNTINGILEDLKGNLWMSTNKGISKFNPDEMSFRNYDVTDGLQGNDFCNNASMITTTGEFYFGGKTGFNVFIPEEIKDNPHIPTVVLTGFQIFNKPVEKLKVKIDGEKTFRTIPEIKEIKVTYKESVISFEFASLDFGNPSKNKYKYKLDGFDKEWSEVPASKRFATYTNLKGGEYVFRVIASNSDAVWNNEGLSVKLIVTPPFWKRAWFILLVILIIAYFAYNYYKEKQANIIRDKRILEEKIKAGLVELEKQKAEVLEKDKELELKILKEKEQNWLNTGMSRFSAIISKNKDNAEILSKSIIVEFIEYLEVEQGALYLYNDDDENDPHLTLVASYAPDEERLIGRRLELNEGQVGASFTERKVIRIDNLPKGYAVISSGLGESFLQHLVVVPLKLNEIVIGVVEFLSFEPLSDFKVGFIEKTGETLTSLLTALRANEKTIKMLEQQKLHAEEFASHEEELRQNLEEMHATKEEADRHVEELRIISEEFVEKEKILQEENERLQLEIDRLTKTDNPLN